METSQICEILTFYLQQSFNQKEKKRQAGKIFQDKIKFYMFKLWDADKHRDYPLSYTLIFY